MRTCRLPRYMRERCKENKKEHLSRHPLLVATFSGLIFGAVVSVIGLWLGAKFQHANWLEQNKILMEKTKYDKRVMIAKEVCYLITKRRHLSWSIYHSSSDMHYYFDAAKRIADKGGDFTDPNNRAFSYRNKVTEYIISNNDIDSQIQRTLQEIKMHFPVEYQELENHITEAGTLCTTIIDNINNTKNLPKSIVHIYSDKISNKLKEINMLFISSI